MFDAQAHCGTPDPEKVEYGQLLTPRVRNFNKVYNIDDDRPRDRHHDDDDDHGRDDD